MLADFNPKKLLNLGCGNRYHCDWVNIDFISTSRQVNPHDLSKGIPCSDNSVDVVYHSHVLEHFTKKNAVKFIKECYRVLKPGGVIRVAVPDLEIIAKNYLSFLLSALAGDKMAEANYDWSVLEMYDQAVRDCGGGEMKKYYRQENMLNKDFVKERMGYFFEIMTQKRTPKTGNTWKRRAVNFLRSITENLPGEKTRRLGKFRLSGEVHKWMYDRFSLARLLKNSGFREICQRTAKESYMENWPSYNLDTEPDESVYKPNSLVMEAKK